MMHGAHPGFLLEAVFSLPKYWSQSCVKCYIHYAMLEYTESKLDYSTIICLCLQRQLLVLVRYSTKVPPNVKFQCSWSNNFDQLWDNSAMYVDVNMHTHTCTHYTHLHANYTHTHTHTHTQHTHTHTTHTHTHTHTHCKPYIHAYYIHIYMHNAQFLSWP